MKTMLKKCILTGLLLLLQVGVCHGIYGLEEHDYVEEQDERDLRLIRCSAGYDEFYYNSSIAMNIFDSDFDMGSCSDNELAEFSQLITDGYDTMIGIDPRLDHVAFLRSEICDAIPEVEDDQSGRNLQFIFGYIQDANYFTRGKYTYKTGGHCRFCPPGKSKDADHGRFLLRQPPKEDKNEPMMLSRPSARQLVPSVVSFSLFNTKTKRKILRLRQYHIIDLQVYGSDLDIIAEYNGFSPDYIKFGLDDNPDHSQSGVRAKFALGGGKGVDELKDVGTHTITATSYGQDGDVGEPFEISLLIIDGEGGKETPSNGTPETREALIAVIEDDASSFLSMWLNEKYFEDPDSCLHGTLVFLKVDLEPVPEDEVPCLTEIDNAPAIDVGSTELVVSDSQTDSCPVMRPEVGGQCDDIGSSCDYGIVCCCGFCTIQHICTCGLNGWRCTTRSYRECPDECPAMCPAELLEMCDPDFWDKQSCGVPGHEQVKCQRECGGRFLDAGFGSSCTCNADSLMWQCETREEIDLCPTDLGCEEEEGKQCGGWQDVQCASGLVCVGVDEGCDPIAGGTECIGRCVLDPGTAATTQADQDEPVEASIFTVESPDPPELELRPDGCPVEKTILGVECDEAGKACDYGAQCCCGQCHKERTCTCEEHGSQYHKFICRDFSVSCDFECTPGSCPYYPPQFDSCVPEHFGEKVCPGSSNDKLKCQTECGKELEDFGYSHGCRCQADGEWVCADATCPPDPCGPEGQPEGGPCGGSQKLSCGAGMKCANKFGGGVCDEESGECNGICTVFRDDGCPVANPHSSGRACLQVSTQCSYGETCCCGSCLPEIDCACEGAPGQGKLTCRQNIFDDCPCSD